MHLINVALVIRSFKDFADLEWLQKREKQGKTAVLSLVETLN